MPEVTRQVYKDINFDLLVQEFEAASSYFEALSMANFSDGSKFITVHIKDGIPPADAAALEATLDAHDASQLTQEQQVTAEELAYVQQLVDMAGTAISNIEADLAAIDTATTAQVVQMLKRSLQRERVEIEVILKLVKEVVRIN